MILRPYQNRAVKKAKAAGVNVNAYVNQDLFRLDISKFDNDKLGELL